MAENNHPRQYRPEQIPRKGEWIAWGSALLVVSAWVILILAGQPVHAAVPFLAVILVLSGLSISLGNWMERHTLLILDDDGIQFTNGLRRVHLSWAEVRELRVINARWGKKVQVFGENAFFEFRTLGEVVVQGKLQGRMGFEKGEEILRRIVMSCGLEIVDQTGEGYYYVRQ